MELTHIDIQARRGQGHLMRIRIRRGLIDLFISPSVRRPDQARHGMPSFDGLIKLHGIARCENGQGTSPGNIYTSIEPMSWDILHREVDYFGKGKIARAI